MGSGSVLFFSLFLQKELTFCCICGIMILDIPFAVFFEDTGIAPILQNHVKVKIKSKLS